MLAARINWTALSEVHFADGVQLLQKPFELSKLYGLARR
jgi:hypothetical protein